MIYRPPDPPVGPDRPSDAYPLTDAAEVAALRREFPQRYRVRIRLDGLALADYLADRELGEWGCNPFEEE